MEKFAAFRPKKHSYLRYGNDENKKVKDTKKCVIKHKFEDYKNFLEGTQLENEINYIEKNKFEVYNLRENHKKLIINKKLILK